MSKFATDRTSALQYGVGPHHVGSYQVSGTPYLTGSATIAAAAEERILFPMVTKSVTVVNHTAQTLRVHFAPQDAVTSNPARDGGNTVTNRHYVELDSDEDSFTFNIKCKEIFISADSGNGADGSYQLYAELTNIPTGTMYALTGAGISD
jgi:hypothetical protein